MTHQYTKLADALENIAQMEYPSAHHDGNNLREAARILRSAAGVDVAGLMAMVKKATTAHYLLGLASGEWRCTPEHHADKDAADAALESALRLALAAREGFVMVPVDPTWEMTKAAIPVLQKQDLVVGDISVVYAAMIAAAPKGTT